MNRKYRFWFSLFLSVLLGGFAIGMLLYGEPFHFWEDPFSGLGATITPNGYHNHTAMAFFVGDMIITGILFIRISTLFAKDTEIAHRGFRLLFSIGASFGAFIAAFPHDLFPLQHQLGSGFLVGGTWFLAIFFLTDLAGLASVKYQMLLHGILHVTVLTYAWCFFFDLPIRDTVQKFAIFGIAVAIEFALATLCRAPAPNTEVSAEGAR